MNRVYKKRFGLFHDPRVAKEIAALDEHADVQRIVHLMSKYEFSWDIVRSLDLALFYSYGSDSVSALLARTGEFEKHGQKRYDDTAILIGHFIESGWDGEYGKRAIERMSKTHGHYTIPNDDFIFVLWTFIEFPIRWAEDYGRRPMTPHEQNAWLNFWVQIGKRMGMVGVPESKADYDNWIEQYESVHMIYAHTTQRIADATVRVIESWLPPFLRSSVKPTVSSLMSDKFLKSVGYEKASSFRRVMVRGVLKLVGKVNSIFVFGAYPHLVAERKDKTYSRGYVIEEVQPVHLSKAQQRKTEAANSAHAPATAEKQGGV